MLHHRKKTGMSNLPSKPQEQADLRRQAERLLSEGEAPASRFGTLAPDALHLLYRMASDVDSASDALKLLHELQAHQVELDMQKAQCEASEYAMEQELLRYRALFDHAPLAYFVLDATGRIIETNRSALALLDVSPGVLEGHLFQEHFVAADRERLSALLAGVRSERGAAPCDMHLQRASGGAQSVRLLPAVGEGGEAILMALVPLDDAVATP